MKISLDRQSVWSCVAALPLLIGNGELALADPAASADPAPQATSAPASATPASSDNEPLGEVVVTARRREESSLKVPIAITALSAQMLEAENVTSMDDIAAITPGLSRDSTTTGSARSDRSFYDLIIRGIVPVGTSGYLLPTTSVFIDGVPITDGDIDGVFDFDRVEVLKGPQSAYFGRETFAGAINVVTKDPGNEYHGYASALAANGNYYDVKGAFEGAVIPDVLTFRTSLRWYKRDGSWDNVAEPGQKLGDQGTKSASLQLNLKASENLTVKLFGVVWQDNDGPGATGVILPSQSNCKFSLGNYFCGTLPGLPAGEPSANTAINTGVSHLLNSYSPIFSPSMEIDHYGLKRDADHFSASIDDVLPDLGLTVSSLTGASEDSWSVLFPLNGVASNYPNVFTGGPYAQTDTNWPFEEQQRNTDFSQEFRVTSDQKQRFRYLVGASYLRTRLEYANSQLYYFGNGGPTFANTIDPIYDSSTFGIFYGLNFDLVPDLLTLDVEGRYQSERLSAVDFTSSSTLYEVVYKDFVPRISLEYHFMPNALAYLTWSKGVDPGQAVDPLASIPAQDQAQAIADGAKTGVKPEFLYNYELGLKGRFLDDRLVFSGDVYYDIWIDKIVSQDILITNPNAPPTYQSIFTNFGKVTLPGVELEVTGKPIDSYVVNASGAIAASHVNQGVCDACALLTGSTSIRGNQLPNYSKYSAQANGEYTGAFPYLPSFKWYQRSEITYKSGQYEGEGDYAKSPAQTYVNFRLGLRSDQIKIEGFVTNAFNNKAYTSVLNDWNLSNPGETYGAYDSVYVGLPFLRTYGLQVRYDF